MTATKGQKLIADNRKARFEYDILDRLETGIVLQGTEVKSVRQGHLSLSESYVKVKRGELYLIGAHIAPYEQGNRFNHEPLRDRKLLAHRHEIRRLDAAVQQKGLTLIPTKAYFVKGRVKIEVGLARGKKLYDKRKAIKDREIERHLQQRVRRDME